jgi:hypothetical protein
MLIVTTRPAFSFTGTSDSRGSTLVSIHGDFCGSGALEPLGEGYTASARSGVISPKAG